MIDSVAPNAAPGNAQLALLARLNADDILDAFGLDGRPLLRALCSPLARRPAARFARQLAYFDALVGARGLRAGGRWAIGQASESFEASGAELLPREGPLLIVANHPGLSDTMALFAAIPRADLLVIAADRPLLRALPQTARHLLFIDGRPAARTATLRAAARHLRGGGALLSFPGGRIEPDPALGPGMQAALERWSGSVELLARLADGLAVAPAIVGGVLSPAAQRHPLTRLRRRPEGRAWLGAIIQLLALRRYPAHVRLRFGPPIHATRDAAPAALRQALLAEARRLVEDFAPAGP